MNKIIINNIEFDYPTGCRLLKLKYKKLPENLSALSSVWDSIIPYSFKEICTNISNIEKRRVAIDCLGLEKLQTEVNPELMSTQTLNKSTKWVDINGNIVIKEFKDTYKLYKVSKEVWSKGVDKHWLNVEDAYFVKFKDTSTDREYMIWVDIRSVLITNGFKVYSNIDTLPIDAVHAIAWTIQINVKVGDIEKIIRQGDCILIKKRPNALISNNRHLTKDEYIKLISLES